MNNKKANEIINNKNIGELLNYLNGIELETHLAITLTTINKLIFIITAKETYEVTNSAIEAANSTIKNILNEDLYDKI